MSITLRIILIVCSFISFFLCIKKIKQSKLKVANSVTWMLGSIIRSEEHTSELQSR